MSHDRMRVVLEHHLESGCNVLQVWDAASGNKRGLRVPGAAEEGSEENRISGIGQLDVGRLAITGGSKYAAAGGCQCTAVDAMEPICIWLGVWYLEEGCDVPLATINLPED